jgi:hypothetical protein
MRHRLEPTQGIRGTRCFADCIRGQAFADESRLSQRQIAPVAGGDHDRFLDKLLLDKELSRSGGPNAAQGLPPHEYSLAQPGTLRPRLPHDAPASLCRHKVLEPRRLSAAD